LVGLQEVYITTLVNNMFDGMLEFLVGFLIVYGGIIAFTIGLFSFLSKRRDKKIEKYFGELDD